MEQKPNNSATKVVHIKSADVWRLGAMKHTTHTQLRELGTGEVPHGKQGAMLPVVNIPGDIWDTRKGRK